MSKSWIQNPLPPYNLIPRNEYVRPKEIQHSIFGDIESFVSPIDGTVITGRKGYDEHCRKHNVINSAEFDGQWSEAAKKRAAFYDGQRSKKETLARKQEIYETIIKSERGELTRRSR